MALPLLRQSLSPSFQRFEPPLAPWLVQAVSAMGFHQMTPVQAATIPLFIQNKDVVVQAVTGSGKTLSFVIPIIERLLKLPPRNHGHIAAIVISPTRELAVQTFNVLHQLLASRPTAARAGPDQAGSPVSSPSSDPFLKAMLLIGGTGTQSIKQDLLDFKQDGANILVATPGRLEEFLLGYSTLARRRAKKLSQGSQPSVMNKLADLKGLEVLVLDEADRLLDLGFAPVLSNIINHLPKQRRTGLFSATLLNDGLTELIRVGLRNPVKVVVKVQTVHQTATESDVGSTGLQNQFLPVPRIEWKIPLLIRMLHQLSYPSNTKGRGARKFIVYFSTCSCVDYFFKILSRLDDMKRYSLHSLHGQQSPKRRSATFDSFKNSSATDPHILLCTDLVARGLDFPDIDVVIQYDPPKDVRTFFHRIGRTARAGRFGRAIVMLHSQREMDYVEYLRIKKVELQRINLPGLPSQPDTDQELSSDSEADEINQKIKMIVKTDRELHDRAVKALVSFVQFYSKHEASYIFNLEKLDVLALAFKGFGLIRLPKMPELKNYHTSGGLLTPQGFSAHAEDFDWDAYKYLDPVKEANRLEKLKTRINVPFQGEEANCPSGPLTPVAEKIQRLEAKKVPVKTPWSNKINAKLSREQKRLKRLRNSEDFPQGVADGDDEESKQDWKELICENKARQRLKVEDNLSKIKGNELASSEQVSAFFNGLAT